MFSGNEPRKKEERGPVGTNGVVNLIIFINVDTEIIIIIIKKKTIGGVLILLLIFNQVD